MLKPAEVNALNLVAEVVHEGLPPAPRLTVSEWADAYRVLSREASAEPGPWRTDRAPYQRGIMDALSDAMVERVVFKKPSQVGATEILNNIVGYFIDQDPAPILVIQPNVEPMGKAWSLDRLAPMVRDTPRLQGKVSDPRSRDSSNTILHKVFPGGHITVAGANSAAGLASRPIRVLLCDEIDRYPASAGTEGDPVELGHQRTRTFWNRKEYLASTPTLKGFSPISAAYLESDQRVYEVPCPSCATFQVLIWKNLRWDEGDPDSAAYYCESCGVRIEESQKGPLLAGGRWTRRNPGSRIAGFWINALYSPWARWAELVREFLAALKDISKFQVFVNTVWAEEWEERGGGLEPGALEARAESYAAPVPAGVGLLTAGVDVQDDRLELVVRGWGVSEESWLIAHEVILGEPGGKPVAGKDDVWKQLDTFLAQKWRHESGKPIGLNTVCIDSGAHTEMVYRFCKPRFGRRIFAVKGSSQPGRPLIGKRPMTNNRYAVRLFILGVDTAKDAIYQRLRIVTPGPAYYHFPTWTSDDYYKQITAEKVMRKQINGRWVRRYELPRGARNEALDCEVYALAALLLASVSRDRIRPLGAPAEPPPAPAPPAEPFAQQRLKSLRQGPKKRGWIDGWKG